MLSASRLVVDIFGTLYRFRVSKRGIYCARWNQSFVYLRDAKENRKPKLTQTSAKVILLSCGGELSMHSANSFIPHFNGRPLPLG